MQRLLQCTGRSSVCAMRTCIDVPELSAAVHRNGKKSGLSNVQRHNLGLSAALLCGLFSGQQPEGHRRSFEQLSASNEQPRGTPSVGERGTIDAAATTARGLNAFATFAASGAVAVGPLALSLH